MLNPRRHHLQHAGPPEHAAMGGVFDPRDGFHRRSQSINHPNFDPNFDYRSLMNSHIGPAPGSAATTTVHGDVSRTPPAGPAYKSHDDRCIDHCMGVGLYNGFQQFNHRGALPSRSAHHLASPRDNSMPHHNQHQALPIAGMGMPMGQFRPQFAVHPSADPYRHCWLPSDFQPIACSEDDCPFEECGLEDCQSGENMSCCDDQCTMTGKCTNVACANKEDACTDLSCPSRAGDLPSDVVDVAATLISINHAPEQSDSGYGLQQSDMDGLHFGLPTSHQAFLFPSHLLPADVGNITNHLLIAHGDSNAPNCTRPCPLDDPQNVPQYCHIPLPNGNLDLTDQYSTLDSSFLIGDAFEVCGAAVPNPDAFLEHFNAQHRPLFTAGNSRYPAGISATRHGLASTETTASVPATPFERSDCSQSLETPSPLTPLSNSVEMVDTKPAVPSSARGGSVASSLEGSAKMDFDEEYRCLWREEGSSEVCNQVFEDAEELFKHACTSHIKHAQKGTQGFRCGWDDCPRSEVGAAGFPQRSKIERHMQTHIGHKPHICPTCHKGFSAKQALTQHMFIHSNEKPLVCNICHKAFRYPSALTMHQRVHTGVKPLKCPVCGKSFSESSNLSKHKRTHEVKGRFACAVPGCDRNFHRQDQLRRHMRTHQGHGRSSEVPESMPAEASFEMPP